MSTFISLFQVLLLSVLLSNPFILSAALKDKLYSVREAANAGQTLSMVALKHTCCYWVLFGK